MNPQHLYLLMTVIGALVPLKQFLPWLVLNGLNIQLMLNDLFANGVSSFFALDVLLSACSLLLFASVERRRRKDSAWWLSVPVTLLFGVSAGLPLTLYLLEKSKIDRKSKGRGCVPPL